MASRGPRFPRQQGPDHPGHEKGYSDKQGVPVRRNRHLVPDHDEEPDQRDDQPGQHQFVWPHGYPPSVRPRFPPRAWRRQARGDAALLPIIVAAWIGCASMQDTPQQEYVWAMGPACDATSNTWFVDKVEADARTATFPGELGKVDPTAPG